MKLLSLKLVTWWYSQKECHALGMCRKLLISITNLSERMDRIQTYRTLC
ncbi:Deoxymugineic acid synthase 1 [Bienertia sinuspersici]